MDSGFYLSPDGLHIVELKKSIDWDFGFSVISGETYMDELFEIAKEDAILIFSSWILLESHEGCVV